MKTYTIHAPLRAVWQALTDEKAVSAWTEEPAEMDETEGSTFSLWGGSIFGVNKHVVPEKELVQEWFASKEWHEPSIVTIRLTEEKDYVHVALIHEQVPDNEAHDIDEGWDTYYFGPLQEFVEHHTS